MKQNAIKKQSSIIKLNVWGFEVRKFKSHFITFLFLDIPDKLLAQFEDYLASGKVIEFIPDNAQNEQRNQQLLQNRLDESEILARKASDLSKGRCQALQGLGLPITCHQGWLYKVGKLLEREALIAQEETGASTLYVALGLLQWTEKGSSLPKLAPLFLYPINLSVIPFMRCWEI